MTKLPAGQYTFMLTLDPYIEAKSSGVSGSRTKKKRGIAGKNASITAGLPASGNMLVQQRESADIRGAREGELLPSFIVITSSQSVRMSQLVESARLKFRHVELRHQQQAWQETLTTRRQLLAQPLYIPLRAFDVKGTTIITHYIIVLLLVVLIFMVWFYDLNDDIAIDSIRAVPEALRQFERVRASFDQSEQQRDAIRTVLAVDVWQIVLEYLR
jgi:hypothetical protein